jgi:hypothetical protein
VLPLLYTAELASARLQSQWVRGDIAIMKWPGSSLSSNIPCPGFQPSSYPQP